MGSGITQLCRVCLTLASVQVLQPPHGLVMVAAKSYYFGVGGGVQSFLKAIKNDNLFEVCHAQKTIEDVTHLVTGGLQEGREGAV